MEATIRTIGVEDAEAVSALVAQLGYRRSPAQIRGWIEELRSGRREQDAFVAVLHGEIAGWIEVSVERRLQAPPFALIGGLVVRDELRSRGIGHLLGIRAEEWAWKCGVESVRVTSRSTRSDAHRFYLREGYREVKTSLVFEKSLPR